MMIVMMTAVKIEEMDPKKRTETLYARKVYVFLVQLFTFGAHRGGDGGY